MPIPGWESVGIPLTPRPVFLGLDPGFAAHALFSPHLIVLGGYWSMLEPLASWYGSLAFLGLLAGFSSSR